MSTVAVVVGFLALLIAAYIYDEWTWRLKPRERLIEIVRSRDWRLHKAAMAELGRRGEDLAGFLPRFLTRLATESKTERVAAETIVRRFYPLAAQELKGYSPIADVEACRERVAPLL